MKEIIELAETKGYESVFESFYKVAGFNKEHEYTEICMINDWIFNLHGIFVEISISNRSYYYDLVILEDYEVINSSYYYDTPQEALKEGIKKALKVLEILNNE